MDLSELQTWVVVGGGILAAWDLLRSRSLKRLEVLAGLMSGPLKDIEGLGDIHRALFLRHYRAAFFLDTRWFPLVGGMLFCVLGGLSLGLIFVTWQAMSPLLIVIMGVVSVLYLGLGAVQLMAIKPMGKQTRILIQERLTKLEKDLLESERAKTASGDASGKQAPKETVGQT